LEITSKLTSLNLAYNKIADSGARHIAEGLLSNRTLTALYLAGNQIGSPGLFAFARSLKINGTLDFLDLNKNNVNETSRKLLLTVREKYELWGKDHIYDDVYVLDDGYEY